MFLTRHLLNFAVPQNRCRRSSDIGDLLRRKRSPSPQHCQTLKFRGINSRRRRLSADDHTSAAASPPSSTEVVLNDFSMSSSSPKKSPNRGRRKSSISIILPSFIGGKRKFFKVIEENQGPPQVCKYNSRYINFNNIFLLVFNNFFL